MWNFHWEIHLAYHCQRELPRSAIIQKGGKADPLPLLFLFVSKHIPFLFLVKFILSKLFSLKHKVYQLQSFFDSFLLIYTIILSKKWTFILKFWFLNWLRVPIIYLECESTVSLFCLRMLYKFLRCQFLSGKVSANICCETSSQRTQRITIVPLCSAWLLLSLKVVPTRNCEMVALSILFC